MENSDKQNANSVIFKLKNFYKLESDIDLAAKLGISNATISNWKARDTLNIRLIIEKAGEIDLNWLFRDEPRDLQIENTANEDQAVYIKSPLKNIGIPMIPHEAVAGIGAGELTIAEKDIEQRYFVPEFAKADYLIRVKGSSMYPKYSAGDVLACKRMDKTRFIQWNKTYVLDTSQGIMVKRIIKGHTSKEWILRSDNKDYQDIELNPDEDVNHISLVIGVIRLE